MSYVYDIILNFNEKFYDFYDWNIKDKIDHIRKIPILKVNDKIFNDFMNYDVTLDESFKNDIYNKTEIFSGRKIKNISYAFLLTNNKKVIALKINDNKIMISDLLIDEEESALELAHILKVANISYKKKELKKIEFKTRKQFELEKKLKASLLNLKSDKNIDKLKYIYFECFSESGNELEDMIEKIENKLDEDFNSFSKKLEYLLKITQNV